MECLSSDILDDLSAKLTSKVIRLEQSNAYYEACFRLKTIGISSPPEMHALTAAIGWPRTYIDAVEERLDIEGFRIGSTPEAVDELWDWWQANNLDERSGMGILEALIYGSAYITVSAPGDLDPPDVPVIRVESPLNMIHETDPRTGDVTVAARFYDKMTGATLFLPDETSYWTKDQNGKWVSTDRNQHDLGVVPVVPVTNRQRVSDHDGQSEITEEIRSFTDAAARAFMNMQAASELMAVPQRVLFGIQKEAIAKAGTPAEVLEAYMARMLVFENEAGKAFQFTAAELRNFVDLLTEIAKHVASYTGLPPQYLSFSSDNPASAEAIRSAESRLVKKCERKARAFGGSFEKAMVLGYKVLDQEPPADIHRLETVWRDPATPTFAAKADAVSKLVAAGIVPVERARVDLGYSETEREQMRKWDEEEKSDQASAVLNSVLRSTVQADAGQLPDAPDDSPL